MERRHLGGTFDKYPEGFNDNPYAVAQTVIFTLSFFVLAVLIALRVQEEDDVRRGKFNNRHLVIACIFFGSSTRVVYIPIIDRVVETPDSVRFLFRMLKDLAWFTAFALLFSFWMEIQAGSSVRNTFTLDKYRLHLLGIIVLYSVLRIMQMCFEIARPDTNAKTWAKGVVGAYLCILYIIGGIGALKLRKRLDNMARSMTRKNRRSVVRVRTALQDTVRRLGIFMLLETFFLVFLTLLAALDFFLEKFKLALPSDEPSANLTIKVLKRFNEFMLIFVLWRMLFVKKPPSEEALGAEETVSAGAVNQRNAYNSFTIGLARLTGTIEGMGHSFLRIVTSSPAKTRSRTSQCSSDGSTGGGTSAKIVSSTELGRSGSGNNNTLGKEIAPADGSDEALPDPGTSRRSIGDERRT